MTRRGGAVHVATTRRRYKGRVYEAHLLRRTYREDGKVKHETLGNLSHLPAHAIEAVRRSLRGEHLVAVDECFEIVRSLPHGHVAATLGTLRNLGLEKLLGSRRCRQRDLVTAMIVARIVEPSSKLATGRAIHRDTAHSTLGELLGVEDAEADELYTAMDWLLPRQGRIEAALAARHLDGTLVLYDVTSTYFEGRTCPLARRGHSRDGKRGTLQIVIGLLCDPEGRPVAVEVFDGNTGDPTTLAPQIAKLRQRFRFERVVLVGDRGLLTSARIRDELRPVAGLSWISALRGPAIAKLVDQGAIAPSLFDQRDLAEITSPDYPGERLMVCRNPLLADERARKRDELLAATEKELAKIAAATTREHRPLRGAARIGVRVGRVVNRYKVAKHFATTITDDSFAYARKQEQIRAERALDGLYVIRTDVPAEQMSGEQVVGNYKSLSVVERAFRCLKTMDLKVRPIHHRKADRVRAHVFLCMLAYYVEWHMRRALAPLLFDDHDRPAARARRRSIVAPARRSAAAQSKATTQQTDEGFTAQSLRDVLAQLGTIVHNRMRRRGGGDKQTFPMTTRPNPHQLRALELLGVGDQV
ncbi:MAG: IS1634 family transposase [Thermoanaerobaculia bacterium]